MYYAYSVHPEECVAQHTISQNFNITGVKKMVKWQCQNQRKQGGKHLPVFSFQLYAVVKS